jgi:hypothetical protein
VAALILANKRAKPTNDDAPGSLGLKPQLVRLLCGMPWQKARRLSMCTVFICFSKSLVPHPLPKSQKYFFFLVVPRPLFSFS